MQKLLIAIILSLTITTSALADYSGSAVLDWSSLTFSAPVDLIPRYQQQGAYLFDQALTQPLGDGEYGLSTGAAKGTSEIVPYPDMGWSNQTAAVMMPNVGAVDSTFSPTALGASLSASATLSGVGFAQSAADVNGFLVAHQTGNLTVSIGYHVANEFAPQGTGLAPDFFSHSHLQLIVTDSTGHFVADVRDVNAPAGSSMQSGVLSVTQYLTAGAHNFFTVSTEMNVNHPQLSSQVQSVPVPDMLWPTTFLGLAGLGWLWWREWRVVR